MSIRSLIVPGLALALAPSLAHASPVVLSATLTGAAETGGGDPDGTGSFRAEIDPQAGDFCYTLKVANIEPATMAHVHQGVAGSNGPPVITIEVGEDTCIAVEPAKLEPILANPAGFYVNVHNAPHPAGAIRGQLARQ
ncbi:MAG TPA: CHRD domain-containing protein [Novosphingobium sp.]|nr:CHRD domain-containing protein [Novosphingobium sp.]HMP56067.1 CHRD domain-containing protein [Novosphingobium sp.]